MTHPVEADVTLLMYLYRVPCVALRGGGCHCSLRFCHSLSSTSNTSIFLFFASILTLSPSFTCKDDKHAVQTLPHTVLRSRTRRKKAVQVSHDA